MYAETPNTGQFVFYVGYAKYLWHGFPNRSVFCHSIMVFGVKWRKTQVMPGFILSHKGNVVS